MDIISYSILNFNASETILRQQRNKHELTAPSIEPGNLLYNWIETCLTWRKSTVCIIHQVPLVLTQNNFNHRKSNYIHYKACDEITNKFSNLGMDK